MLTFQQYRKLYQEAGTSVYAGDDTSQPPATATATASTNVSIDKTLSDEINKIVDDVVGKWEQSLKQDLFSTKVPPPHAQKGIWDRFKNTLANVYHGRYSTENPYYWKNRYGDVLGASQPAAPVKANSQKPASELQSQTNVGIGFNNPNEYFNPNLFSLSDYKELKGTCSLIENQIQKHLLTEDENIENLQLNRVLTTSIANLKQQLKQVILSKIQDKLSQANKNKNDVKDQNPFYSSYDTISIGGGTGGTGYIGGTGDIGGDKAPLEIKDPNRIESIHYWNSLSREDKNKFDERGGGRSSTEYEYTYRPHQKQEKVKIRGTLPWLLRHDDPRLKFLTNHKKSILRKFDRIEDANNRLTDEQVDQKIKEIQVKMQDEKRRRSEQGQLLTTR